MCRGRKKVSIWCRLRYKWDEINGTTYSKGAMAAFDTAARATRAPSDVWTRIVLVVTSQTAVPWTRRLVIFGSVKSTERGGEVWAVGSWLEAGEESVDCGQRMTVAENLKKERMERRKGGLCGRERKVGGEGEEGRES